MGSEFRSRFRSLLAPTRSAMLISHTGIEGGNHRELRRFEWLRESRIESEHGEIGETTKQRRAEVEVTEQDGGPREAGIRSDSERAEARDTVEPKASRDVTESASPTRVRLQAERSGGEAGIRTLGRSLSPYNGLANRRLKPLGHLTADAKCT